MCIFLVWHKVCHVIGSRMTHGSLDINYTKDTTSQWLVIYFKLKLKGCHTNFFFTVFIRMLWNCNPRIFKLDSVFLCHGITHLSGSLSLWLLFLCRRALSWDRKSWSWSRRWRISSCQLSTSSWDSTADTSASSKLAIMYVNKIQTQITDKIIIKR